MTPRCTLWIDTTTLSKKQIYQARCHFFSHLPTNVYDSLKVFRRCYIRLGKDNNLVDNLKDMNIELGNLNKNSVKYCVKKWISILEKTHKCQDDVFQPCLNRLSYFQLLRKLWTIFESNYYLKYFQNHFASVN